MQKQLFTDVLQNRCSKNFANFTGKHGLEYFNKVSGLRPATLLKRGSNRGVFLSNFYEHILSQNTSGDCFCRCILSLYQNDMQIKEIKFFAGVYAYLPLTNRPHVLAKFWQSSVCMMSKTRRSTSAAKYLLTLNSSEKITRMYARFVKHNPLLCK